MATKAWYRNRIKREQEIKNSATRRTMAAVHPNAAIRGMYEKKINRLMSSLMKGLPELAENWYASRLIALRSKPAIRTHDAKTRRKTLKQKTEEWRERYTSDKYWLQEGYYEKASAEIAEWFGVKVSNNVDVQWNQSAKASGLPEFIVPISEPMREQLRGVIAENVELIRSIPKKYLARVEAAVNESIQNGSDLKTLREKIQSIQGVTKRQAALIARDQTNKATGAFFRQRSRDAGIRKGIWIHSLARKNPRHSHLEAGKKRLEFDLEKGAWLRDDNTGGYRFQQPGFEINCGCTYRPVVYIGGEKIA